MMDAAELRLNRAYRYLRFVSPAFIQSPKRRGNVSNR